MVCVLLNYNTYNIKLTVHVQYHVADLTLLLGGANWGRMAPPFALVAFCEEMQIIECY